MLTQKQKDLLLLIHTRLGQDGVAPSFDEMREQLGLKSKSGIHRLISALVERGYLQRLPHRARALEVTRLPENHTADKKSSAKSTSVFSSPKYDSIPLFGRIAAGTPIEAIRHEGQSLDLPPGMLGKGDHYALEVDGDSMIKAGIHDGDMVIIKRCDNAEDGAIVVALVEGEDVTLKRIKRVKNKVHLIPENDCYQTRILDSDQVDIQGRLVSLMRTYH
ncbi:MAG: transcriptional repressor LexA [Alphaproteobacteria bacterium]|nr:transcriptional repressor LexA [Alphaproteobacteria bacterium]